MIKDIIEKYVQDACKNNNNVFGDGFFEQHVLVVLNYASQLAEILGADKEIIELSAYLHDISVIRDFHTFSEHHIISSNSALEILMRNGYPEEKAQRVKQCILTHSNPMNVKDGSIEEVCLSNADAMSKVTNPAYWLYFGYSIRKYSFDEGKNWYLKMIDTGWESLIEPAKGLIKGKYDSVKALML